MSFTGVADVDLVLVDLYEEEAILRKALRKKPNEPTLLKRCNNIVVLIDHLLMAGQVLQLLSNVETLNGIEDMS